MLSKKIFKIRNKLDKIDNKLLLLIKSRGKLVDLVLKEKQYKKEIIDNKRIKLILKNIKRKSLDKNIDPVITLKIWKAMISAFIDYEYRNFKKK
jgi:chorismate mutase